MQAEQYPLHIIARIHTDFPEKFGIPRQSGLVDALRARIVFEPEFRNADALRGIEGYTHLWLIWQFSKAVRTDGSWSPTVRPPRLGGNTRMGVFATRSPFRPNALGLSCVTLQGVDYDAPDGPALLVGGADLLDGTPIFDIKPYLPYVDSHPDARGGFADAFTEYALSVNVPTDLWERVPVSKREALLGVLKNDPRPAYQNDPARIYGMEFGGLTVKFTVRDTLLTVTDVFLKDQRPSDSF